MEKQLIKAEDLAHRIAERRRLAEQNRRARQTKISKDQYLSDKLELSSWRNPQRNTPDGNHSMADDDAVITVHTFTDSSSASLAPDTHTSTEKKKTQ